MHWGVNRSTSRQQAGLRRRAAQAEVEIAISGSTCLRPSSTICHGTKGAAPLLFSKTDLLLFPMMHAIGIPLFLGPDFCLETDSLRGNQELEAPELSVFWQN